VLDPYHPFEDDRDVVEVGTLAGFHPAAGRHHARHARHVVARVHAPDELLNLFRLVARRLHDGGAFDESRHGQDAIPSERQ